MVQKEGSSVLPFLRMRAFKILGVLGCVLVLSAQSPLEIVRQNFSKAARVPAPIERPSAELSAGIGEKTGVPTLAPQNSAALEEAILLYQDIVRRGGWPQLPPLQKPLTLGMREKIIPLLRQRLAMSGDLILTPSNEVRKPSFDRALKAAVQRFQWRHGLRSDGIVARQTWKALNVPAAKRLNQLQTNLVRLRILSENLESHYVLVNSAAARIEAVRDGRVESYHIAVVGKLDRQTPVLTSAITELNFHPYWTVPQSIIKRDLIPLMQKDPSYLAKHNIQVLDWKGNLQNATALDWNSDEPLHYMFRQDPGARNSLGRVRINFENPYQIYLHDTPLQSLFQEAFRFQSSGCVRVENMPALVQWILTGEEGWRPEDVTEALENGVRQNVRLSHPIPLYITYLTAWAEAGGMIHFREDLYGRDEAPLLPPPTPTETQEVQNHTRPPLKAEASADAPSQTHFSAQIRGVPKTKQDALLKVTSLPRGRKGGE